MLSLLLSWFFTSTDTIKLISDGQREGEGDYIYLSLHCNHMTPALKMDNDESHFNVSLTVRDKVTGQCRQTSTFEEKGEPKRNRAETLLFTSLMPYR